MKILIVAMSESIHTARWLSQIDDQGWDIHLFPSLDCGLTHPKMQNLTVYYPFYPRQRPDLNVKIKGIPVRYAPLAFLASALAKRIIPNYRVMQLKRLIDKIKPDIIHSMETQAAGYLTSEVRNLYKKTFPLWIHTIWGSDMYLFGQLKAHQEKIKDVMESCDFLLCECRRDIESARVYGFKGNFLLVSSAEGGFDLELCSTLRSSHKTSDRRNIMLKGYHGWAGRALVGLRALERCTDILKGYEILVFSASRKVTAAAKLFQKTTGIPTKIIPHGTPHQEILSFHGKARLSIGLSISDGLPSSFLEALVMGSFPIQSWTACADEWIEDGVTGLLVPPEDPDVIEKAIRRALTDDDLVNRAAELNWKTAVERLDQSILKPKAIEIYTTVAKDKGTVNEN